jgi:DNA-binding NarL/FixJ family response regulator
MPKLEKSKGRKARAGAAKRTLFLVDSHDLVRFGARQLISQERDLVVCGEAKSLSEAMPLIASERPELVITGISLRKSNGLDLVKLVKADFPKIATLVLSAHDELIWAEVSLRAGARGYLMKEDSLEHLVSAIRSVLAGNTYLSAAVTERLLRAQFGRGDKSRMSALTRLSYRQVRILQLLGQLKVTREIAADLSIGTRSVSYHKDRLRKKLQFESSVELSRFALQFYSNNLTAGT